jgi:hypothetical protein
MAMGVSERVRLAAKGGGRTKIDHDKRVIFGVSCAQAVEALGHGMILDTKTLDQLVELGNGAKGGRGVKSRYTHPGLSSDGMGKYLGRLRNWRRVGDRALADLHLSEMASKSPDGDLGSYVLGMAQEDPESFGLSVSISISRVWVLEGGVEIPWRSGEKPPEGATTDKPIVRVKELHACDVVDEPAANRDGLFSSALWGTNQLAAEAFEELDRLLEEYNVSPERAFEFALSYLAQRGVDVSEFRRLERLDEVEEWSAMDTEVKVSSGERGDAVAQGSEAAIANMNEWTAAVARSAAMKIVQDAALPGPSKERLMRRQFANPAEAYQAIEDERSYIASLQADRTVTGLHPVVERMRDSHDQLQEAMDWMLGVPGVAAPAPNLRSFRDLYLYITGDYDFYGVFDPDRSNFAAANTSTLAGMAVNALNKAVMMHYNQMTLWRWYEPIVAVVPHDGSTHDVQMIYVDGVANLDVVGEGQAYQEKTVGDSKESMAFTKLGNFVGITLEMIRRSDIARIQAIPRVLAISSLRTRSAAIASIFTVNGGTGPTLAQDSTVLFHVANHGNLGTAAFSAAEWAVARSRIYKQVVPGTGKPFGVWPRYVLLPIDLYDAALELFGYGAGREEVGRAVATGQTVNPYAQDRPNDPRPIPIAVPDWTDTSDWAYIVDPRLQPVINMAFANNPGGNSFPPPELFEVRGETNGLMFTNDTLPVKVRDWWSYGVSTYVGVGRNLVS